MKIIDWFIQKVINNVMKSEEFQKLVKEKAYELTAEMIKQAFKKPYKLSTDYLLSWDYDLTHINNAIVEAFVGRMTDYVNRCMIDYQSNYEKYIKSETFIDEMIDRINRKQLHLNKD